MAERKSIKNYDVLNDITGQEDDIALMGYKISNSTTKGIRASALGADSRVYDKEINELKEELDNNTECFLTGENKNIGLHNGYISLSNGGTNTNISRCVFTDFLPNTEVVFSSENSEYIIYLLKYNMSDNSFVGYEVVNSNKRPYTIYPSEQYKYKVAFCNTGDMNAEKTESELLDIRNKLILYFKNPLEKRVNKIEDSVLTEKISLIKQEFSVGTLQSASFSVSTATEGMTYLKHIQAQTGDTISVVVPTVDDVIFKYRFGFYDSEKNYLDQIPFSETNEITVTVSGTEYIAFCIIAYNSDGTAHTNIINDFSQNDIFVFENKTRFVGIDRLHSEIVELQNKKREYRAIIDAAMKPKNITSNGYLSQLQPLALFHFSDIHGDAIETDRIGRVYHDIADKCDDVICTGDIVELRYSNDATFMTDGSGSQKYLLAIGNHDVLTDESGFDFTQRATQEQQYAKFFAANIANWGVTYTENKTYYYKDYAAKQIRLIVVNNMLTDTGATDQLNWLESTLEDAKTNDYSVVIGMHYPVYGFTKIDCAFTRRDKEIHAADCADVSICQSVQTFIDGGGDFICYVCGHQHGDYIGYSSAYPSQIAVLVDSASRTQSNQYSDLMRVDGEISQDVYNVVVFDKSISAIKVVRIGCAVDNYMRHRDMICLDYRTKEILSFGLPV